MSKYINTSSYKNMFSISKKLFDLLETNNVINHINIRKYDLEDEGINPLKDNQNIPPKAAT